MKEFSQQTRIDNLKKLAHDEFDLLILGGGITGAGVARDAAGRGMKVALVEAHDYAFGTSSRSSKLVHGGIRYLENKEFHLVFEALNERTKLFQIAPHLVHPLRFMIPLFADSRVGMFKMGLGMWLYDALSLFQTPEMHERLSMLMILKVRLSIRMLIWMMIDLCMKHCARLMNTVLYA
jgi:glycerol-3-phosphate dehydrogenase